MAFTYTSVITRPNTGVAWFKDANPAAYDAILSAVRSAPGFVNGNWNPDPTNPNRFIATHTWNNKASWQAMSTGLQSLGAQQLQNAYRLQNNITVNTTLSE